MKSLLPKTCGWALIMLMLLTAVTASASRMVYGPNEDEEEIDDTWFLVAQIADTDPTTSPISFVNSHTSRSVSLEPEIANVTINGNTLTVKDGVESKTYIGVTDEQNRQMTAAKVKVTAGQAFNGQIVMERKYLVNNVNNYCYQTSSFRMDNGVQLQIRYYNTNYWQGSSSNSHHGIFIAVGRCEDVNWDWDVSDCEYFYEWYIGPVVTDEWVNEKIVIDNNGDVQYFMNGENMGTHHFDMLTMDNAQTVTFDIHPYGWWTGHHHYMDDWKLTVPGQTISDNFNDGVIDTNIWQTPTYPDGVFEEDGIMKTEQVQTDCPFHIRTNPIPLTAHPVAQTGCPDDNHPHIIDLGAAGKWACCNVGATKPEECGGYFAWGETKEKNYYDYTTYSLYNVIDDEADISGTAYDAATANWGTPWSLPSFRQLMNLVDNCTTEWVQVNGVNGTKFTGYNGNSIFLPAAGVRMEETLQEENEMGYYWSSTNHSFLPYGLEFDDYGLESFLSGYMGAECGLPVRPIQNKQVIPSNQEGYPTGTVKYDNVPAENLPMVKQLFNDLRLVPEGGQVKKFYITVNEVRSDLWQALMAAPIVEGESAGEEITDILEAVPTESAINQFITLLRQQTGKRFRLPTAEERKWAEACQVIDTIADKADSYGAGFHLALDTIGIAKAKMLVITAKDGTESRFRLRSLPRVTVEKPYLVVKGDGIDVSFELEQMQRMHYEEDPTPTGIDEANEQQAATDQEEETIRFNNLPTGTTVGIYTIDGKQIYSHASDGSTFSLPLSTLKNGVYIVKANGLTYKIQKP